jgi:hypothetical protein
VSKFSFGKLVVFSFTLFAIAACSETTTHISQSYRNPGFEQTVFKKLFVIGVGDTQERRKAFEDDFVAAIVAQGGSATTSWTVLPKAEQLTEEEIRSAVEAGGFDGVLISRLLSVDKEKEYTPGSTYYNAKTNYYGGGYGYGYGGYYGFYGTTYAKMHEPGYFETSTTIRVETNLYSIASDELVWNGQSDTIDPKSISDARASVTAAVAKKLKEEKLIP